MAYALLIDTSLCVGCKGCQVSCKQWWQLGAEETVQRGSYQNPPDMSWKTWTVVKFSEVEIGGSIRWLFAKDQCRHCPEPMPCKLVCPRGDEVITKEESGAVVFNQALCGGCNLECVRYCPYGVPKPEIGPDGEQYCRAYKCRLCNDRINNGDIPACAKTCLTGAVSFGYQDEMILKAQSRVSALRSAGYTEANIYPNTHSNVMWVLLTKNEDYQLASYIEKKPELHKKQHSKVALRVMKNKKEGSSVSRASVFIPAIGAVALAGSAIRYLVERKEKVAACEKDDKRQT